MSWAFDDTCRLSSDGGSWVGFIVEIDVRGDGGTLYLVDLKGPADREFFLENNVVRWWDISTKNM